MSRILSVPYPNGFSPSDISGLKLWLKADAITGLSDGDPVTTWSDSSGQGNDATQSTAGQKPLYKTAIQNSLPAVRFDATDDVLKTQADGTLKPFSLFAVIKVADLSTTRTLIGSWNGTNNSIASGGISIDLATASKTRFLKAEVVVIGTSTTAPTTSTLIVGVTYDGSGNYAFYKNGAADGSGTNDQTFTADRKILIGALRPDGLIPFNADAFELVRYDSVLDSTQRGNIHTYLNGKWAVY